MLCSAKTMATFECFNYCSNFIPLNFLEMMFACREMFKGEDKEISMYNTCRG